MDFRESTSDHKIYERDISFEDIATAFLKTIAITCIIITAVNLTDCIVSRQMLSSARTYNEACKVVNSLPLEERRILAKALKKELNEEKLLVPKNGLLFWEMTPKMLSPTFILLLAVVGFLLAPSVNAVICYERHRKKRFYFVDLPCRGVKRTILVLLLWTAWGPMLISYFRMWRANHKAEKLRQEIEVIIRENQDQAGQNLTDQECADLTLEKVIREKVTHNFTEEDFATYYAARIGANEKYRSHSLFNLKEKAEHLRCSIKDHSEAIQALQQDLGKIRAEIRELESLMQLPPLEESEIHREWAEFQTMRGIYRIETIVHSKDSGESNTEFQFYVRVQIPHEKEIYDLGDYVVIIESSPRTDYRYRFAARLIRSGARNDKLFCAYQAGGQFCFGNRIDTIYRYLQENDFLSAIALAIDSLHFINPGDYGSILPYLRKIETIEQIGQARSRIANRGKGGTS